MVNRSKQKGDREERAVVDLHRSLGVNATRTLERGARSDGTATWDVDIYARGVEAAPLIGECKMRASGFKQIYDWLGLNDFLTIRTNNKERLYVVPERVWVEIIKKMGQP